MSRRKIAIVVALVVVQLAVVGVYLWVEQSRGAEEKRASLGTAPPQPTSGRVRAFQVETRDGTTRDLIGGERPVLVHFWGTWCRPCIEELPLVLDLPHDLPFEVVAVALDEDWSDVEAFLGGEIDPRVVLADPSRAAERFDVSSLPETVLITGEGEKLLRVNGARAWDDPGFLERWTEAATGR